MLLSNDSGVGFRVAEASGYDFEKSKGKWTGSAARPTV